MVDHKCRECDRGFDSENALSMHRSSKHGNHSKNTVNKKNMKNWIIFIGIVGLIVLASYALYLNSQAPGAHDSFAQCLTDSDAKMFGAYWCPHCQDQKSLFGKSWKLVNYVECSLQNQGGQNEICNNEGIKSYPTWEFADGERVVGAMSFEQLSAITGCSIE